MKSLGDTYKAYKVRRCDLNNYLDKKWEES